MKICHALECANLNFSPLTVNNLGTIHKRRRQFFRIFDTPLLHVGSFLELFVGNFDQCLTPHPHPNCRRRLSKAPYNNFDEVKYVVHINFCLYTSVWGCQY